MSNPSGIKPTEFNVLFLPDEVAERTRGGIIIPDDNRERQQFVATKGVLVAVSPHAFSYADWPDGARKPAPGDRVIVAKASGMEVEGADGRKVKILKDKDVVAFCDLTEG